MPSRNNSEAIAFTTDRWIENLRVDGDLHPRFVKTSSGLMQWGSGSAVTDCALSRSGAAAMSLTGSFTASGSLSGASLQLAGTEIINSGALYMPQILCRVSVDLTAAAQTTLLTVPAGKTLKVVRVMAEGQTTISGAGKTSVLKVGTTGASYAELFNGSTGHSFVVNTATTLLAVGAILDPEELYPPTSASVAKTGSFAAASVIQASVSGATPVTGGAVYLMIEGFYV